MANPGQKYVLNISYGISQINCSTSEDKYYINNSHNLNNQKINMASFGVFDGHGGKFASNYLAQLLHESIIQAYCDSVNNSPQLADEIASAKTEVMDKLLCEAIRGSFKKVDKVIKAQSDAGSTSVSLFLTSLPDGSTRVLCPWVGDSKGVLYIRHPQTNKLHTVPTTQDHKPSLQREAERIMGGTGVLWTGLPMELSIDNPLDDQEFAPNAEGGAAEEPAADAPPAADASPAEANSNEQVVTPDMGTEAEGDGIQLDNRRSFIDTRGKIGADGKKIQGPLAVFSRTGVSICMTRSIGDRFGPRSCLWLPDVSAITISKTEHGRFVIGSDGIWDVVTLDQAKDMAMQFKDPQKAAESLAQRASFLRTQKKMRKDDITVICVDVNPDLFQSALAGGCCTIS